MSGARFARTGRCRFFLGFCALIVMIGMVAIFHSSQEELEEVRHSILQCEQNLEALKKRWQITMEQKAEIEKTRKEEQSEHIATKRGFEQRLKEQSDQHAKEQMDARIKFEKLEQTHKLLQSDHELLVNECAKSKKQQLEDANSLEKKLQSLRSELQKAKSLQESEIALWKDKYNAASKENSRLQTLLEVADAAGEQTKRIRQLQDALAEYSAHCDYKPKSFAFDGLQQQQQQINNPLQSPETTHNAKSGAQFQMPSFDKPKSEKYFKEQRSILPKQPIQKVVSNEQETQLKQQPDDDLGGVGDRDKKIVAPLSAPRKLTSTQSAKSEQRVLEAGGSQRNASVSISSSSSNLPPLQMPPNQRKQIPEMVAPIPELNEFMKNDDERQAQKEEHVNGVGGGGVGGGLADIDAAIEDTQRQENDDGTGNNRYANVVNDMEAPAAKPANNKQSKDAAAAAAVGENDSGAHEIKDQDLANEPNFNVPVVENGGGDNNNFFDAGDDKHHHHHAANRAIGGGGGGGEGGDSHKHKDEMDNEDDDLGMGMGGGGMGGAGAGDIAVKNHNLFGGGDSLNNEVAGDQGKEFPDGLHIEDANDEMNEDEDEDEYANPAARQQGAQAIRN